jgi:hypothetical protein
MALNFAKVGYSRLDGRVSRKVKALRMGVLF